MAAGWSEGILIEAIKERSIDECCGISDNDDFDSNCLMSIEEII